jgi:photosystem I subunit 11
MTLDVTPPNGDPQIGNLETPVNSSAFSRTLLNSLPAYRRGLSPQRRGLEIGMAHGYLLYGPFAFTSQFRNTEFADLVGLIQAVILVVVLTLCLSVYSSVSVNKPVKSTPIAEVPEALGTQEGWSEFAGSFLVGGIGGAGFAFLVYQVFESGVFETFGNLV